MFFLSFSPDPFSDIGEIRDDTRSKDKLSDEEVLLQTLDADIAKVICPLGFFSLFKKSLRNVQPEIISEYPSQNAFWAKTFFSLNMISGGIAILLTRS